MVSWFFLSFFLFFLAFCDSRTFRQKTQKTHPCPSTATTLPLRNMKCQTGQRASLQRVECQMSSFPKPIACQSNTFYLISLEIKAQRWKRQAKQGSACVHILMGAPPVFVYVMYNHSEDPVWTLGLKLKLFTRAYMEMWKNGWFARKEWKTLFKSHRFHLGAIQKCDVPDKRKDHFSSEVPALTHKKWGHLAKIIRIIKHML